jgi:hypothetical protein
MIAAPVTTTVRRTRSLVAALLSTDSVAALASLDRLVARPASACSQTMVGCHYVAVVVMLVLTCVF